jgi:hypothetical protein
MSARQDIGRLLEQWLQLTKAEATAIQAADWSAVAKIQTSKAALQKALEAERQGRMLYRRGPEADAIQAKIARLISLESRNAELIAAQQLRARAEQSALEQTRRTLHKVKRSYNHPKSPTEWQCYS